MGKRDDLASLARQRKADRYKNFMPVGAFHNGAYDSGDYISPWTRSAGNYDSPLMIVAQDWISADKLAGPINPLWIRMGQDPNLPTNKNLSRLLSEIFGVQWGDLYATNLFVFVKPRGMSHPIEARDLLYCADTYLLPQIRIVKPRMVVCLGKATLNAVRRAAGHAHIDLSQAQGREDAAHVDESAIYGVNHPGAWGTRNAGGYHNLERQWRSLEKIYRYLLGNN